MIGIAIDLYDERNLSREEINNEWPDDLLSPKGDSQALAANGGPEQLLRPGRVKAHSTRAFLQKSPPCDRR
ncbi:MAG TPA: hypothetical protein VN764_08095 [Polyangiaceae bacterium]|nr:hypothetical protein [Polyangiaceae bacterium]